MSPFSSLFVYTFFHDVDILPYNTSIILSAEPVLPLSTVPYRGCRVISPPAPRPFPSLRVRVWDTQSPTTLRRTVEDLVPTYVVAFTAFGVSFSRNVMGREGGDFGLSYDTNQDNSGSST